MPRIFAFALTGVLTAAQAVPAAASSIDESHNFQRYAAAIFFGIQGVPKVGSPTDSWRPGDEDTWLNEFSNLGANMEPGEPTLGGTTHHTVWEDFTVPPDVPSARVVVQTFGSNRSGNELDTVLGIYTGSTVNALTLVTSNDNATVPGVSTTQSLVQFNVSANVQYSIQIGSRVEGQTGFVSSNVFMFPPSGGLSAFLATLNGSRAPPGDFICLGGCLWPKFVLHNSTNQTMVVNASHDLGAGVTTPPQISLPPGTLGTMEFQFTPAFDRTTVRTVAGHFTFTGKKTNGTIVNVARHRALIVIKPTTTLPDILRATITPSVQAGLINEGLTYRVRLYNTGAQTAIGCHVRSRSAFSGVQTVWQEYDPGSPPGGTSRPATVGPLRAPLTIPAGQSVLTLVYTASHQSRIAVPAFAGSNQPFIVDCANTQPAPITLANAFDFTARGAYAPARVTTSRLAPKGAVLDVPAGGAGFRVSAVNGGPAATLVARPYYIRPFDETAANKQFTVKICRTNAAGACTSAEFNSIQFSAEEGVTNLFKVIVRPPAVDPGYDPGKRRVFLVFDQAQPVGNIFSVAVASQSIAVRKN